MTDALRGVTAVVTGAGSGLGRAFAVEIGKLGGRAMLSDIDVEGADETASLVRREGGEARAVHGDVRSLERTREIADEAERWLGPIDLVVNNAGVAVSGPFDQISIEDWRWIVDINLWGVVHGCHVHVPRMRARGKGYVVNVASAAGLLCPPEMSPYNVTKAAVVALSETLHAELSGSGVNVTVLCPTFFRTNIMDTARGVVDEGQRDITGKMMDRSKIQADGVARAALDAVARDRLYAVPMLDGRMFWRLKRAAPSGFQELIGRVARSKLLERLVR